MTEHEQNIAILEACGWTHIENDGIRKPFWVGYPPVGAIVGKKQPLPEIDLNFMHKAEGILTDEQYVYFESHLECATCRSQKPNRLTYRYYSATSDKRREAFLRTLGKWKDS